MSVKSTIESLDFFKTLNSQEIELLTSISTIHSYNSEYILYYEKEHSNNLLFLISGLAKTYKIDKHSNEIFLYYIYKESLISEITNIKSKTLTSFSNVSLIEDSQVLSIDYEQFKKHFLEKKLLCLELVNEISLRSQKIESLINREFIFDSVQKVSQMLNTDLEMFNKLKRHDISLILHIQPATLSRVLNRLKRNKIIDILQGQITVLNTIALKEIGND
ncbi:Crp/Fnr family transcriptional regulator [Sulfurimonas sp.]|uniref:Crp/Fnr family transcriptional regulator n=1 Tax=Sulfurimonas sp. TaxID=2022749 RepID=UPI0025CE9A96|nr:Crp/Fnr family transcriptional regulator [Sulfurimonas sp.]